MCLSCCFCSFWLCVFFYAVLCYFMLFLLLLSKSVVAVLLCWYVAVVVVVIDVAVVVAVVVVVVAAAAVAVFVAATCFSCCLIGSCVYLWPLPHFWALVLCPSGLEVGTLESLGPVLWRLQSSIQGAPDKRLHRSADWGVYKPCSSLAAAIAVAVKCGNPSQGT